MSEHAFVPPDFVGVGGIFVDDIVYADGTTRMAVLGGGVSHAAAGMRIWGQRAGIVACAGRDLPDAARQRLERDFDTRGLIWLDIPQARAWQLFEWDGQRREIYRVDELAPFVYRPAPGEVPPVFHAARAVYLLRDIDSLADWRALYPHATLLWEPLQQVMLAENTAAFRAALPHTDIVSPNWIEAEAIYGTDDPAALVYAMLADGARIAALRMGEAGSLVGMQGDPAVLRVPAVPVPDVIDQTGAGNTYCGAFLAGWQIAHDLRQAAAYGAVAASFCLEGVGVADPLPGFEAERDQRLAWALARMEPVPVTDQ
ncbi:PfkB family carbohydrate kinase [Aggregatilinea lenta]|uniref:PfkB family carbohydrate kinase n=1 Tax=Aggregatilinea lenta TaxID=913108 RepID=UPI000E5C389D|nr:PfkB family carbohydrate kinase [Aggregatilinea lenta]